MWIIEQTRIGRILVPPGVPAGHAVFITTEDFPGRITPEIALDLTAVVREISSVDASLTTCTQVHGAAAARAERRKEWRECDSCDAIWSPEQGVALGIKIADCLPVTIIDPDHHVIANIHSGWRGAAQKIVRQTATTLQRETAFDPAAAQAYLGPSIRACCFEVGEEVAEHFEGYVQRERQKPHVDLVGWTRAELVELGFNDSRISDSGLCTRCEGSIFHSYRRSGANSGRNLAIVAQ